MNPVTRILACAAVCVMPGCFEMESPAEMDGRILPGIAQELLLHGSSDKIIGAPSTLRAAFLRHSKEPLGFRIGSSDSNADTGILFYSEKPENVVISVPLNQNERKGYYNYVNASQKAR